MSGATAAASRPVGDEKWLLISLNDEKWLLIFTQLLGATAAASGPVGQQANNGGAEVSPEEGKTWLNAARRGDLAVLKSLVAKNSRLVAYQVKIAFFFIECTPCGVPGENW